MKTETFWEVGARCCAYRKKRFGQYEQRLAVGRLVSFFLMLGGLFGCYPYVGPGVFALLCGVFGLYVIAVAGVHYQLKKTVLFWGSLGQSYQLSRARQRRDFALLGQHKPVWHDGVISVPTDHPYAHDIDLPTDFFLLLNTCFTKRGSVLLWDRLLTAGTPAAKSSPDKQAVADRRFVPLLAAEPKALRYLEAQRLQRLAEGPGVQDTASPLQESPLTVPGLVMAYLWTSLLVWVVLFTVGLQAFLHTHAHDVVIRCAFFYSIFLLFGAYLTQPFLSRYQAQLRTIQSMQLVKKHLNNPDYYKDLCPFFGDKAQVHLRIFSVLSDVLALRGNPVFWLVLHLFFPCDSVLSLLIFRSFQKQKAPFLGWIESFSRFDALCSLARFAVENPEFRFCEFAHSKEGVVAKQMGHPLLPASRRICQTFTLEQETPVILLTGSNMAGKSTFLRAFATNMLLLHVGAPVCAQEFQAPAYPILCAISIEDSLSHSTSYFYAEVNRLAAMLSVMNQGMRCFFFIDEIFRGTNNTERYQGSLAVIKALLGTGSFGVVSTHDLALADLAKTDTRLCNKHFKEQVLDGQLVFDYLLRDGPCPTTNALLIMKQRGLPV